MYEIAVDPGAGSGRIDQDHQDNGEPPENIERQKALRLLFDCLFHNQ